ncbi:monovalent cation/H+ antiporter subunit D family protein [Chromatocurvus halotolerans]|uniref:Multisubunit sodium/proton antiporter MrpD subunit n=1 Tax=Chromatocurvus halotolerans TaxID=1132028 RepID=A0A4R2KGJ6_9GAMM|nr:monovalent cation/H+ antiporter subunit D family protein [Chromatocurvus halotolerans]TCO72723.1 multisubunit sodium/proton antiporter MrpD subunit [Chromatocurvus halotolerans]
MVHLPVLQVVIPLMAAPALLLLNRPWQSWLLTCLVTITAFAISVSLLGTVYSTGTISYELGGWEPPWGIEYRIDLLSAYVLLIVSGVAALVAVASRQGLDADVATDKQPTLYVLYCLCLAGLLGIVATGDLFNVFVFLEISSLSTYALIAMGPHRRALWASYQYLVVGTIGATFLLIGIGFIYSLTGTLNMQDIAARLPLVDADRTVHTAFAFIVVGVCLKLALFPLHFWLPNAYTYAPSIVTAFLAATSTKVAVYLLIRLHYSIFGANFALDVLPLNLLFLILGLAGVFAASLVAVQQPNVKRLFAYSSIAQIGYMIVGLGLGTVIGLQATLLHLFNHALMKGALFLAIAGVVYRVGGSDLAHFAGLGRLMPWTMAAIVIGGLSLIGVPLTVGFISKWYLVLGAIEAGLWPVAGLVLIASVLALFYVWRIVEVAYFESPTALTESAREAPLGMLLATWVLVGANIYFGIDTELTRQTSELAAQHLMGGQP